VLLFFAFWRNGLEFIAHFLGVFYAPSIIFLAAIFAIIIFLVHLSVVNSRQQKQIREMAQEIALIREKYKNV
jgi:membrane protein insertase Oxa1/YidC/SpoIIIJ